MLCTHDDKSCHGVWVYNNVVVKQHVSRQDTAQHLADVNVHFLGPVCLSCLGNPQKASLKPSSHAIIDSLTSAARAVKCGMHIVHVSSATAGVAWLSCYCCSARPQCQSTSPVNTGHPYPYIVVVTGHLWCCLPAVPFWPASSMTAAAAAPLRLT